ncbi:MAG: enoyl-CoA hydratase/isomerase family protein [Proteobacteria bacterium]|nr:enoyl-CoA hydratase/isomerase family protein [Pseudomonadota bacterium]MBU1451703.1 enoyl-CoA hydratase/isomerase family protein [Pseudomonadota bacterium]MBU2467621.1 enoyl-CoA hydratase/isomerase family protein [Pseudomonadota bacterium]MBU2516125.1 enoyl-CoA hydratase/isomerase family protein [Pseudomonadota bacterium]
MAGEFSLLSLRPGPQICWAAIERQVDRNSINSQLMAEVEALLEQVESSPAQVLVFTGAGSSHFIGGADGIEMMQLDRPGALAFSRRFQALLDRMEASPLLLVAAINGLCFGGGFEFALACDLRVAAHGARIGLPEVKVGLIPGGGGTQRLPRLVGQGLAMEMILGGKLHPGEDAARLGLVHRAVPDGQLERGVDELLEPILRNPGYALSLAKRAVKAAQGNPLPQGLEAEAELFSHCHDQSFFRDLMVEQMRSGALTTSADQTRTTKGDDK